MTPSKVNTNVRLSNFFTERLGESVNGFEGWCVVFKSLDNKPRIYDGYRDIK